MASEDDDATIHMLVHGGTENRTDEDVDAKAALAGVKNESKNVGAWDSFFHFYGLIVHQQNMLHDQVRTGTYKAACMENKVDFKGKVVVDVGTGTGILALFAAQAGAKKVYAIEASNIAENARALVKANGYEDVITVIKGKVEDVTLPEKVDLIISEPMGFLLVHERMLEVMLLAREKWLKPKEEGGKIFPTTGTIYACPFTDQALYDERCAETAFWDQPDFFGTYCLPSHPPRT
jgi:type I protein arginine methyltransferase